MNPLICECGNEIKITHFVTHPLDIHRILSKIGWPTEIPEFDPPYDFSELHVCQLIPGTKDGFFDDRALIQGEVGPDPPFIDYSCDPPHWENEVI